MLEYKTEKEWLTVMEMKEYMRICRKTAYKLVQEGEIPSRRISPRKILIRREDIDEYILRH